MQNIELCKLSEDMVRLLIESDPFRRQSYPLRRSGAAMQSGLFLVVKGKGGSKTLHWKQQQCTRVYYGIHISTLIDTPECWAIG